MANKKMKFKGHGTFFVRKGWLGKGLKAVRENSQTLNPSNTEIAMDELGLGKNMVGSLRYWLKTLDLIKENGKGKDMHAEFTDFGELVYEYDPYVEEVGTLCALHCVLAGQKYEATSWYYLFNVFGSGSFTKDEFVDGVSKFETLEHQKVNSENQVGVARSSIESDFECILSSYISHEHRSGKKVSPENVIDCPLGELGIIELDEASGRTYRKRQPSLASLPSIFILFSILKAAEEKKIKRQRTDILEIPIDDLLNEANYPGRLFNLDSVALLSILYALENDGYVRINRTAGSDVVRIDCQFDKWDCLKKYYELIG